MSMQDHPEHPGAPAPGPVRRPATRPPHLTGMTLILLLLIVLLTLPRVSAYLAERIQFAITRGQQRAKAEVAREFLKNMPQSANRFAWVAKKIEPSVVGIVTTRLVAGRPLSDEWFHLFPQSGEGSGVVVDEEGYIVTNAHVIENAAQVTVKLSDGRTIQDVEVVGGPDWEADLAVLKIDVDGLIAAPWGDSDELEVGDEVLAVGNPYRLARTVTAGIISAKGRPGVVGPLAHQEFLQTDAAVNPGNSGGPLVNMNGEVVGINTAIVGQSYRGISFAIPSRVAQEVYRQLRTSGKVKPRGWLGVWMEELTDREAAQLGLDKTYGVEVLAVAVDSPADQAGIRPGDVILRWNGQEIHNPAELSLAVVRAKIGEQGTIELLRNSGNLEIAVTVGPRPVLRRR